MKILIGVLFFGMMLAFGCLESSGPTACTLEAKLCPDGSYVGRVPPDCEFEACPETQFCDALTPCSGGYECYSFEDEDTPICYIGTDPCERCSSRNCIILESYPMQIRCIEDEELPFGDFCGWSTNGSCSSDSDCIKSGCSGQVCQSVSEEPAVTTCEWRDCYNPAPYDLSCECISGKCRWQ